MEQLVLVDRSPPHRTVGPSEISQLPDDALTPIDIVKVPSKPKTTRCDASVSVVVVGSVSALAGLAVTTAAISAAPAAAPITVKIFRHLTAFPFPVGFVIEAAAAAHPVPPRPFHDLARTHWNGAETALKRLHFALRYPRQGASLNGGYRSVTRTNA